MVGGTRSAVHVTVLETVLVLLQPSLAVNIRVCETVQPVVEIEPSTEVIVGKPHPSVAVAVANAALIAVDVGLQPSVTSM